MSPPRPANLKSLLPCCFCHYVHLILVECLAVYMSRDGLMLLWENPYSSLSSRKASLSSMGDGHRIVALYSALIPASEPLVKHSDRCSRHGGGQAIAARPACQLPAVG